MDAKHFVTQAILATACLLLTRWGWKELRRERRDPRSFPLVSGPFMGGRGLGVSAAALLVVLGVLLLIFKLHLVPKSSPLVFTATLGWISLGLVFFLIGALTRVARRAALGWIDLIGEDTLRVEAEGKSATLTLRPGCARLRYVDGGAAYMQLDVQDGDAALHVWGMVTLRDLRLGEEGVVTEARGLMVATSMSPLCRFVAPYLRRAGVPPAG